MSSGDNCITRHKNTYKCHQDKVVAKTEATRCRHSVHCVVELKAEANAKREKR